VDDCADVGADGQGVTTESGDLRAHWVKPELELVVTGVQVAQLIILSASQMKAVERIMVGQARENQDADHVVEPVGGGLGHRPDKRKPVGLRVKGQSGVARCQVKPAIEVKAALILSFQQRSDVVP